MAQRKTLTQRQIDVLRWIGDGCPDGVEEGYAERITAGALRNRGLVTTRGKGATWSAAITAAGSEYVAQVDGPNPPIPREPNMPVARRLIEEIVAAGGTLRVPRRRWGGLSGTPDYERRVAHAERQGAVPVGKRLVVTHSGDELRIELLDAPEGTPTSSSPVPVPDRVSRYHRIVSELRAQAGRHEISRAQLPRVSRILQGFVAEAEQRGYGVALPGTSDSHHQGRPEWSGESDGHLVLTIEGVAVALRVREDGVSTRAVYPRHDYRHLPTDRSAKPSYLHEQGAKGTVRISIVGPYNRSNRQSSWGDAKTQRLEDRLPAVLMEVETVAAEVRERLEIERQESERRRLAWEGAMTAARACHTEHHRAEILDAQIDAWQRACAIRHYCDAVEKEHAGAAGAAGWVAWARAHADLIDPLVSALAVPEPPTKVPPEELVPYLDGWSPYGPERATRHR